jgi:anti-sigma regulatory factor (Ser/Thr protein kinase)
MKMQAHGGAEVPDARAAARAGGPGADTGPAILPARAGRQHPGPATRTTGLILGPVQTAPRCARGVLAAALAQWGLTRLREPGEEITSELVTNAITASRKAAPPSTGPLPVTVWITAGDTELCIRVWDPEPAPPPADPSLPGDLAESGRGLFIVAALASRWGWHPAPNGGKYVWAALPLGPGPPAA